eukprot:Nk52_evm13s265 gene=Nk52_evmTU13s265
MEAHLIKQRHEKGTLGRIMYPSAEDLRPPTPKKVPKKPKNFTKSNMRKLRNLEDNVRKKKEEEEMKKQVIENPPPAFKMKRFSQVESKVAKHIKNMKNSAEERQNSARARKYLKAHSIKKDLPEKPSKEDIERLRAKRIVMKPPIPKAKDTRPQPERKKREFIRENALQTIHTHPPATPPGTPPPSTTVEKIHPRGCVPKYLGKIKGELDAAKAAAEQAKKKDKVPKGMVLVSEDVRRETLKHLQSNYDNTLTELRRLPLAVDTLGLKRKKIGLEGQLDEIEQAMKFFSQKRVLIRKEDEGFQVLPMSCIPVSR